MTQNSASPVRRLPLPEFVAMMALVSAVVAFSIDSMLPALPEIAALLTPDDVNRAQLVLTAFMAGMGVGTFFSGPISDAIGRKPTVTIGFTLYAIAAIVATQSKTLDFLLIARFVMGLGASAPRIATMALVRDLYQGREMARITSIVSMIFILIPAVAPLLGRLVMHAFGWQGVFGSFVLLAIVGCLWVNLRQAETLTVDRRRPFRLSSLFGGAAEVLRNRQVVLITLILALGFGQMFALLSSAEQLFRTTFGRGETFPLWFAAMALFSGMASLLNAKLVFRLGMKRMAWTAYRMQLVVSLIMVPLVYLELIPEALRFPVFFFWAVSVFAMAGVTFGNLNALALQSMGHLAGTTASVVSALSTFGAVVIAAPVGLMFDGSLRPMVAATLICSTLASILMRWVREV
ncbi:multidrug effflux MFS transporter [Paracoccus sp. (in: a-proteobacteria)]|uniref:multidrug effflux MFS transporter n=1 Tax=Paracoccus sp. TaxID=267 RepID=UPI00289C07FB|nr:multidrug effflux MFS transporter [Paracoccus sp. (in: a-proteobacteria)]